MGRLQRKVKRASRKLVLQLLELGNWGLGKTAQMAGMSTREMPWDAGKFGTCMIKVQDNPTRSDGHSYSKEDARKICAAEMWYSVGLGPHVDFDHTFKKNRKKTVQPMI